MEFLLEEGMSPPTVDTSVFTALETTTLTITQQETQVLGISRKARFG